MKLELLQVVPGRAYVEMREATMKGKLSGKKRSSCTMCFKIETERGFAVGMGSVAPEQRPKNSKNIDFMENFTWTELANDIDGCWLPP